MEPAGLAIGLTGVLSIFTTCVDFFEYVQLARHLGDDFQTIMIQLDLIKLRFSRWGQAVGITGDDDDESVVQRLKRTMGIADKEIGIIKNTLRKVLQLLETAAKGASKLVRNRKRTKNAGDSVGKENDNLRTLHHSIRELTIEKQEKLEGSSMKQKAAWVLHGKKEMENVIDNLSGLVSKLIELTPSTKELQNEICQQDLSSLESDQNLVHLDNTLQMPSTGGHTIIDSELQDLVAKAIDQRRGVMSKAEWKRSNAGEGSKIQQGNRIIDNYQGFIHQNPSSYLVEDSELGKNVDFHQGNRYEG